MSVALLFNSYHKKYRYQSMVPDLVVKPQSFLAYCFINQRRLLIFAILLNAVLFTGYHYQLYPVPNFFGDSYRYVISAQQCVDVNFRPAGYPYFLRALHVFSESAVFVVVVQYALLILSSLFLYCTVSYLLVFRLRAIRIFAIAGTVFNPLFLILANQIGNDAFYTALIISWVALMIWVLLRASWLALMLSIIVLFFAFQVRYNALYYPFIACFVFLVALPKGRWIYRFAGIFLTITTIGFTYAKIQELTYRHTGVNVFSGFSGWQLANNALYIYPYTGIKPRAFRHTKYREIDSFVNLYFNSELGKIKDYNAEGSIGAYFMWNRSSPLRHYLEYYGTTHRSFIDIDWYELSVPMGEYGKKIIFDHPGAYLKYYIWPGFKGYLYPWAETFERYDTPNLPWIQQMTYYKIDLGILSHPPNTTPLKIITAIYPVLHILMVLFCLAMPLIIVISVIRNRTFLQYRKQFTLAVFWLIFFGAHIIFTLLTSVAILRIEALWYVLALGIPLWLLDNWVSKLKHQLTHA